MKIKNTSVQVYGKTVPIKFEENIQVNGQPVLGYFDLEKFSIHIEKRQTKEHMTETLLHEIGHAMMHRLYLTGVIDPNLCEILVEGFAKVMVENFKLVKK